MMKLRMPRIRSAVPRVRVPRVPRVRAAAHRFGARTASGARTLASSYRRWRRRRRQRPVRESLFRFSSGGSGSGSQQDQERERERQRLRERFRQWRQQRAARSRHGWQTPVRGESLSRMMAAARAVEAHRVRPPFAHPGHLRTPALRAPVRMPTPAARTPRPRLRLPGRHAR